jgi:hypothetical protein
MSEALIGRIRLVKYHNGDQFVVAFTRRGRKFLHVVTIDSPMTVTKCRIAEERYMVPLKKGDDFYPYKRAVNKFLHAGKRLGISDRARAILKQAAASVNPDALVEEAA